MERKPKHSFDADDIQQPCDDDDGDEDVDPILSPTSNAHSHHFHNEVEVLVENIDDDNHDNENESDTDADAATEDVMVDVDVASSLDENENIVPESDKPSDHKKSLFSGRKRIFRRFKRIRQNFDVYNLFGDFARFLGLKGVAIKVKFPTEVVKKAIILGETSPGVRPIPRLRHTFKDANFSQRKDKAIRIGIGPEFKPMIPGIRDTSGFGEGCEKCMMSCSPHHPYSTDYDYADTKTVYKRASRKKSKSSLRKKRNSSDLTTVTESFMNHVNVADVFLIEHKTNTLASALVDVDAPLSQRKEKVPPPSKFDYVDELKPLSKSRLGKLAGNVWLFANCVPLLLFTSDDTPTQSSFRSLLDHFAELSMSANTRTLSVVKHSRDFYNYAHEAMRVIRNLQLKLHLKGETVVKQPIKLGSGLKLDRRGNLGARPQITVMVAVAELGDKPPQWKNFESMSSSTKSVALKGLLQSTLCEYDHAKHQIDFLVDDCKETTLDKKNDSDLLYRLSEMYNCIVHVIAKSQTSPTEKSMNELNLVCETMSKFIMSLNCFVAASEHIMSKLIEVRDMIQLTYTYMWEDMGLDLETFMEPEKGRPEKIKPSRRNCWPKKKSKHELDLGPHPYYSATDLFWASYEDLFDTTITADGFLFMIKKSPKPVATKGRTLPKINFRQSVPNAISFLPGKSGSCSSIVSLEAAQEIVPEPHLKPILKVVSPTGSNEDIHSGRPMKAKVSVGFVDTDVQAKKSPSEGSDH